MILIEMNMTGSVYRICGALLELRERAGRIDAEMRDERRVMPNSRTIVHMTSIDLTYDYIKDAHGDVVLEYNVESSQFACTAVLI